MDSILLGQAVFKKVLAKVGGPFAAARQLQISPWTFHRVLHGEASVSDDLFDRAMRIVFEKGAEHPAVNLRN